MSWKAALRSGWVFTRTLAAFYCVGKYGVFISRVTGPSMFPTFSGRDDVVIVNAASAALGRIHKGDIVICIRPVDPSEHIVKRVTAVAGEEVVLYPDRDHADIRRVTVPTGHVWIQGDNLLHSLDSRVYGPVPLALVRGQVFLQVWPSLKWFGSGPSAA